LSAKVFERKKVRKTGFSNNNKKIEIFWRQSLLVLLFRDNDNFSKTLSVSKFWLSHSSLCSLFHSRLFSEIKSFRIFSPQLTISIPFSVCFSFNTLLVSDYYSLVLLTRALNWLAQAKYDRIWLDLAFLFLSRSFSNTIGLKTKTIPARWKRETLIDWLKNVFFSSWIFFLPHNLIDSVVIFGPKYT